MKVTKSLTDEMSFSNKAGVHPQDFEESAKHVCMRTKTGEFYFSLLKDAKVPRGVIALSGPQRKWAYVVVGEEVRVIRFIQFHQLLYFS